MFLLSSKDMHHFENILLRDWKPFSSELTKLHVSLILLLSESMSFTQHWLRVFLCSWSKQALAMGLISLFQLMVTQMQFLDMTKLYEPQVSAFCRRNRATSCLIQPEKSTYIPTSVRKGSNVCEMARDILQEGQIGVPHESMTPSFKGCILINFFYLRGLKLQQLNSFVLPFFLTPGVCWTWVISRNPLFFWAHNIPSSHAKEKEKGHRVLCCFAWVVQLPSSSI